MPNVLVAYATKYGSTAEVAQAIGIHLAKAGAKVEVGSVGNVRALDGYDAVVLAAPLYIGALLKDARRFLERHEKLLRALPVAVALLGPTSSNDDIDEAKKQIQPALAKTPWLSPVATEMFVGTYDPARLRGLDRLLAGIPASPLHGRPAADDRDWVAIGAWSGALPEVLGVSVDE